MATYKTINVSNNIASITVVGTDKKAHYEKAIE